LTYLKGWKFVLQFNVGANKNAQVVLQVYIIFLPNSIVRYFEQTAEALVQQANFNLTVSSDNVTFMGLNVR